MEVGDEFVLHAKADAGAKVFFVRTMMPFAAWTAPDLPLVLVLVAGHSRRRLVGRRVGLTTRQDSAAMARRSQVRPAGLTHRRWFSVLEALGVLAVASGDPEVRVGRVHYDGVYAVVWYAADDVEASRRI